MLFKLDYSSKKFCFIKSPEYLSLDLLKILYVNKELIWVLKDVTSEEKEKEEEKQDMSKEEGKEEDEEVKQEMSEEEEEEKKTKNKKKRGTGCFSWVRSRQRQARKSKYIFPVCVPHLVKGC